ncbi:MAG: hypothetical protein LBH98_02530 [Chitinispirillales bacterium]|jgi:peptidoglycan/xylan/chitin deacetylase (PgdA/CDA1 family)|nr:hypothetical protein [Chitinispirillales bacterium]
MRKSILAAGAAFALAATAMGGNYAFPSPWNPAGKAAEDVTQYVLFIWDDNAYSGIEGSYYEDKAGTLAWNEGGRVGGKRPEGDTWSPTNNPLNIIETGPGKKFGINWAVENLAKTKGIKMTFNMITGLYANVWSDGTEAQGDAWQNYQSLMGYHSDYPGFTKRAVSWGREQRIAVGGKNSPIIQQMFMYDITQKMIQAGCEIGNHTIDHMEANSVLPGGSHSSSNSWGFGRWDTGGDFGSGFMGSNANKLPWQTQTIDENATYGYGSSSAWETKVGWGVYAGCWLNAQTWEGLISLGEEWLKRGSGRNDTEGGAGLGQSYKIYGFRAPRLEVNSAMFYALDKLNYEYDCGLEEGYEDHVDGYNFLWPYTLDNGVRNSWSQMNIGERVFVDSTPVGFWEIPVNCVIVPEGLRAELARKHNKINPTDDPVPAVWNGKITSFDFNMWILYGMNKTEYVEVMKNTFDRRYNGNRAPMQYGCHTDYYTPMYDYQTLLRPFDRQTYGLVVDSGWNTWEIRQQGTEEFVDYAKGMLNTEFVTGHGLVEELNNLNAESEARIKKTENLDDARFVGYNNKGNEIGSEFTGSTGDSGIKLNVAPGDDNQPLYIYMFEQTYDSLTHISIDYKSRTATAINLLIDKNGNGEWDGEYDDNGKYDPNGDEIRQVTLAHRYSPVSINGTGNQNWEGADFRNSGKIPLTSFDFEPYYEGVRNYSSIDPSKIIGIQIVPLAPYGHIPEYNEVPAFNKRGDDFELGFAFKNIRLHSGKKFEYDADDLPDNDSKDVVAIATTVNTKGARFAVAGISANSLRLSIATAGKYDIKVFGVNGRLLQSFNAQSLTSGYNTLKLNNLAKGVYLIKVQGIDMKQQLTKSALVL